MDDIGILVLCHSYKKVAFSGHLSKSGLVNCIYGEKLIWITACLGRLVLNSRPSQCVAGCTCSLVPLEKKKTALLPCSSKTKSWFSMFPVPQNCLCSPVPLIFRPFFPRSPEKMPLFPFSQKPLGGPQILKHLAYMLYIANGKTNRVLFCTNSLGRNAWRYLAPFHDVILPIWR